MSSEQGGTSGQGPVSDRMRALLSRAAEEQLHEQRQVSAVLGELRTLLEDVDERLVTGEQVERLTAQVRELSARVEARLDAADARADELAERMVQATALVEGAERRLATHVDDAVLALAEVVLRRRTAAVAPAPGGQPSPAQDPPADEPAEQAAPEDAADERPVEDAAAEVPADDAAAEVPAEDAAAEVPVEDATSPPEPEPGPAGQLPAPAAVDLAAVEDGEAAARGSAPPGPGDGFVLVPADVEDAGAEPAPVVAQERRVADRRGTARGDGSGRRRRPWWRRA